MTETRENYDAGTELDKPDAATPAYALRELADWIESRATTLPSTRDAVHKDLGGTPGKPSPGDLARIELGREMADGLDKMFEVHSKTITALHDRIGELEAMKDLRTVQKKLDEILEYISPSEKQIGVDPADEPDQPGVAGYQVPVAKTPAEPVEAHQCSRLDFDRGDQMLGTRLLTVRCDLGRETDIDMEKLVKMAAHPQDALLAVARRVAAEHGLNVQDLFEKMRRHSLADLKTITLGTSSLPTPRQT